MPARKFIHSISILPTAPNGRVQSVSLDTLQISDLPATGTPSSSTYLRGDGTWAAVSGGVTSVNGYSGAVTLAASDVGAAPTGPVTSSGLTMATARLLGRTTASTGAIEQITVGSGLSLSGGALSCTVTPGTGTVTSVGLTPPAAGITASGSPVTASGNITLALADDLAAVEGLSGTGLAVRTAANTWANRTLTAPAAGITVSNGNGVSGNPTLALADDLAALEALTGTDTIYRRSGASTWSPVTIGSGLSFTGGTLSASGGQVTVVPGGRITATSGNAAGPDSYSPSTIYYTPYVHDRITLWDGSAWVTVAFTEQTMGLSGLSPGAAYDIFGYLSGGTLAIERVVWSTTISRATAITLQDGRLCKSGDKTRLYLGTFYAISSTITADSPGFRCIWNMYNRISKSLKVIETADSWTYTTQAWRPANNNSGNRVLVLRGLDEDAVNVTVTALINTAPGHSGSVGVGMDTTSTYSGVVGYVNANGAINTYANYTGLTGIGLRALWWLEYSQIGAPTYYGDGGAPAFVQCGLTGTTLT